MNKIISVICAMLVTLTSVTACSDNTEEPVTESTTTALVVQDTAEASSAVEETAEAEVYNSRYQLSNPEADVNAHKLYDYINDVYGTAIMTGQQESTWMGSPDYEMDYIFEKTGKYPAIRGLDCMNNDFDGVVKRSVEWHEKGNNT